jgi:hypothetical protein
LARFEFPLRIVPVDPPRAKVLPGLPKTSVNAALAAPVMHMTFGVPSKSEAIKTIVDYADARLAPTEDDLASADEFPIPSDEMRAAGRELAKRILAAIIGRNYLMVPTFEAGGDGGIGLHWRTDRIELLATLSPRSNIARYYGETVDGSTIKGDIKPDSPLGFLAQWLVENAFPGRRDP